MDYRLQYKPEFINYAEESIGRKLHCIESISIFNDSMLFITQLNGAKLKQWDILYQIKFRDLLQQKRINDKN